MQNYKNYCFSPIENENKKRMIVQKAKLKLITTMIATKNCALRKIVYSLNNKRNNSYVSHHKDKRKCEVFITLLYNII